MSANLSLKAVPHTHCHQLLNSIGLLAALTPEMAAIVRSRKPHPLGREVDLVRSSEVCDRSDRQARTVGMDVHITVWCGAASTLETGICV
jgi:hypothetical protein